MTQSLLKVWDIILKLRALWFILAALFFAFGFGFQTPNSQFEQLRASDAQIRATQDTFRLRLRDYRVARDSDAHLIKALSIAQCIDRLSKGREGKRELQMMQMPCSELLGGQ